VRAVLTGAVIGLVAANVWPLLFVSLGLPSAAVAETVFLGLFLFWAAGGGPPARMRAACVAIAMSAASAGICEEVGFRGYMQQPIERQRRFRRGIPR